MLEVWKVTSIYHPELPYNKVLWRRLLQPKANIAPRRKDFYKSHVSILKITNSNGKIRQESNLVHIVKKNFLVLENTKSSLTCSHTSCRHQD
jgi:hypothetical protein